MIRIQVLNAKGECLKEGRSERLFYEGEYAPGDRIVVSGEAHLWLQLDVALPAGEVYAPGGTFDYAIPFALEKNAYPPVAFKGTRHVIAARALTEAERAEPRNLALNPYDQRREVNAFPHATSNIETRGESVFAARCAIDGMTMNLSHGDWPFQSWGMDIAYDAEITVDFGRDVEVDGIGLYLRADFPHDSWWTRMTLALSDGERISLSLQKTESLQTFSLGGRRVRWMRLEDLVKFDEPAEFPALSTWEVYGRDVPEQ
jgi:hypothetical protein